jgi:hypothetical protein
MRKCILLLFLFNGFSSLGLWSSNIYVNGSTYFIGPNANLVEANLAVGKWSDIKHITNSVPVDSDAAFFRFRIVE